MILQQTRGVLSSGDQLALDLQFASDKSVRARIGPNPTFTRASLATFIGSDGLIQTASTNTPRFDHDPVTGICRGLLMEDARANLLLQSVTLLTQTVSVTAVAHTLSFYGTGTVVLSGAHSASVNGWGAYPTLRAYSFTPTAGSLTLTVTGTVQFANLEVGAFATSWIPTTTNPLTRSADVCSISGANFSGMWNATEGTIYAHFYTYRATTSAPILTAGRAGTEFGKIQIGRVGTTRGTFSIRDDSGSEPFNYLNTTLLPFTKSRAALAYRHNDCIGRINLLSSSLDTSVTLGTQNELFIGGHTNRAHCGAVDSIRVYRRRLSLGKLQALNA